MSGSEYKQSTRHETADVCECFEFTLGMKDRGEDPHQLRLRAPGLQGKGVRDLANLRVPSAVCRFCEGVELL